MRPLLRATTVAAILVAMVSGILTGASAAAAETPPEEAALAVVRAVHDGRMDDAAALVLPDAGDLAAQLEYLLANHIGSDWRLWTGWSLEVAGVDRPDRAVAEVRLSIQDMWVVTMTLRRAGTSKIGSWLAAGVAVGNNVRIDHEDLYIAVDPRYQATSGSVTLDVTLLTAHPEFALRYYSGLAVSDVQCDGVPAHTIQILGQPMKVRLPEAAPGRTYVISYRFSGTIDDRDSRGRAYKDILPGGAYFSDIFGNGAEADVTISVPKGWIAAAAGTPGPKQGGLPSDRIDFRFRRAVGESTAITVGRYTRMAFSAGDTTVKWYLVSEHAKNQDLIKEISQRVLAFAEERLGEYPYPDLIIAEIPPEHGGGTRIANMIMVVPHITEGLSATSSWESLVSHEILHNWWGSGTHQFCIEALTNYTVDWMFSETDPDVASANRAYHRQSYLEVPVAEDAPILQMRSLYADRWYFPIVYQKGALVYGMLRCEIGDDAFEETLRRFSGEAVRSPQRLQTLAEQASEQDLDWFFRQWLETTERLDLSLEIASRQKCGDGYHTILKIINDSPIEVHRVGVLVRTADGDRTAVANLDRSGGQIEFVTPAPVTGAILDPEGVFLDVNLKNNSVGMGLLDWESVWRPWALSVRTLLAVLSFVAAAAIAVRETKRRDIRLTLQRIAVQFGFTHMPSADAQHMADLHMAAAKTFGAPSLAHNVDGGYPCAYGTYRGRLIVIRVPARDRAAALTHGLRMAVHFPYDGTGFTISRRPWLVRLAHFATGAVDPLFDRRFSIRAEHGHGLVLDDRARDAVVALGRTGSHGIRLTPFGAFYYAGGPLTPSGAAAVLDALTAIADSLTAARESQHRQ